MPRFISALHCGILISVKYELDLSNIEVIAVQNSQKILGICTAPIVLDKSMPEIFLYNFNKAVVDFNENFDVVVKYGDEILFNGLINHTSLKSHGGFVRISDYKLLLCISSLSTYPQIQPELTIDTFNHSSLLETITTPKSLKIYEDEYDIRFLELVLPNEFVDGNIHYFRLECENGELASLEWRSLPKYYIEEYKNNTIRMWFTDFGLVDEPLTVKGIVHDHILVETLTFKRLDVFEVVGRLHVGLSLTLSGPGTDAAFVTIYAGSRRQMKIATIYRSHLNYELDTARKLSRFFRENSTDYENSKNPLIAKIELLRNVSNEDNFHVIDHLFEISEKNISVIIPVYRGVHDTISCLESLFSSVNSADALIKEIIIINDCSPDNGMQEVLDRYSHYKSSANVIVLTNQANIGFVRTVNIGIEYASKSNDLILLNSDTVVPIGFASRLKNAAYSRNNVASVTPLSNNATIMSFPAINAGNAITEVDLQEIDNLARVSLKSYSEEVPVANGYCMYIVRRALSEIGLLDESWGKGYCEEVDWCLKASDAGWIHLCAMDTFVLHEGSVSFGAAERIAILEENHRKLESKYIDYVPSIRRFLSDDPLGPAKSHLFVEWILANSRKLIIHFLHQYGGGTQKFVDDLNNLSNKSGYLSLSCFLRENKWLGNIEAVLRWEEKNAELVVPRDQIKNVLAELIKIEDAEIKFFIHAILDAGDIVYHLQTLGSTQYTVFIHDFQWYCPRVVLVDHTNFYCGEPEIKYCQLCVRANEVYDFGIFKELIKSDLSKWLELNRNLLVHAENIICPSEDTATRIQARFNLHNVIVRSHPEESTKSKISRNPDADKVTRVAIVGAISLAKGHDVILELCRYIEANDLPMHIDVVGTVSKVELFEKFNCLNITGRYAPDELYRLLEIANPHYVFFPAIWPETYSYTLSEVWRAGYPVVSFPIGAIAERITKNGGGYLLPKYFNAATLYADLIKSRNYCASLTGRDMVLGKKYATIKEYIDTMT